MASYDDDGYIQKLVDFHATKYHAQKVSEQYRIRDPAADTLWLQVDVDIRKVHREAITVFLFKVDARVSIVDKDETAETQDALTHLQCRDLQSKLKFLNSTGHGHSDRYDRAWSWISAYDRWIFDKKIKEPTVETDRECAGRRAESIRQSLQTSHFRHMKKSDLEMPHQRVLDFLNAHVGETALEDIALKVISRVGYEWLHGSRILALYATDKGKYPGNMDDFYALRDEAGSRSLCSRLLCGERVALLLNESPDLHLEAYAACGIAFELRLKFDLDLDEDEDGDTRRPRRGGSSDNRMPIWLLKVSTMAAIV